MKNISWRKRLHNKYVIEVGEVVPCEICGEILWVKITSIDKPIGESEKVWGFWYKDKKCLNKDDEGQSYIPRIDIEKTIEELENGTIEY